MTVFRSGSPAATERVGRALGGLLRDGDLVLLSGELGAGKTRFVKGVAAGFGAARPEEVVSPTFLRVEQYGPPGRRLRHVDAARPYAPRDKGKVMPVIMAELRGKADGS